MTVTDTDTGTARDPTTLTCRIQAPTGTVTDQTLSTGVLKLATGQYRAIMDTAPASQIWLYEWIADSVSIAKGQVTVRAAIAAPA